MAGADAWIAWVFGAVAVLLIGLVYAELGAALPRAGGFVRYPDFTHGSLVGYMIGFASMLAYSSVAGIEVEAVRGYAQYWWPALGDPSGGPTMLGIIVQIALLVFFFLLNYWSVNIFGKTNTIITFLKFAVPLLTIILLLTQANWGNFSVGGAVPGGLHGIAKAVASGGIVFAFLGFRQAVDFGAEAKNPQRDIPLAIILAVLLGAVIYVLLQIAFVAAVPASELGNGWAGIHFKSPFAGLATAIGLGWLANLLLIDAVISPAGTGNIYLSGTARTLFAWAKNGYFYSIFQKVDPRTGVPRGALWLTLILSALWTLPVQFKMWPFICGGFAIPVGFYSCHMDHLLERLGDRFPVNRYHTLLPRALFRIHGQGRCAPSADGHRMEIRNLARHLLHLHPRHVSLWNIWTRRHTCAHPRTMELHHRRCWSTHPLLLGRCFSTQDSKNRG